MTLTLAEPIGLALDASGPLLVGGPLRFGGLALHRRGAAAMRIAVADADPALLAPLIATPAPIAGLSLDRPRLMGIVNVTPDSFSDGGHFFDHGRAIAHGEALAAAGADILDIGGESTRPGAAPVPVEDEMARVLPVVRALAAAGHRVSIDSRRAAVIAAAVAAGAAIINDVTGLADPEARRIAAESGRPVVLMHMRGEPRDMARHTDYDDLLLTVAEALADRRDACLAAGIPAARIILDPGIGFAKTARQSAALIGHIAAFHALGCPLLLGVSRKSMIGRLSRDEAADARLPGSLAAALAGLRRGVQVLRVHDVGETAQAIRLWQAIDGTAAA